MNSIFKDKIVLRSNPEEILNSFESAKYELLQQFQTNAMQGK
jgi:hypothetical protein